MSEFARFAALLNNTMGLDAKSVGMSLIERAVRERCASCGAVDTDAYWEVLQRTPAELQKLIEAVIVPETWFFRDAEAFRVLARQAWAHCLQSPRPLRVLSLPCSTGEEPYSIAMALLDAGVPPSRFRIDAVDICTRSLASAQRAQYGQNSFRGKDLAFRDWHFTRAGDRYVLNGVVRSQVQFSRGNLLAQSLLVGAKPYDFIFCRNVLIYFDPPMQSRAVAVLGRLLHDTGLLFVGPSEGGVLVRENMLSANMPLAFAFRQPAGARTSGAGKAIAAAHPGTGLLASAGKLVGQRMMRPTRAPVQPASSCAAVRPAVERRAIEAAATWPASSTPQGAPGKEAIMLATQLANQGQLREAAALCRRHVEDNPPSAAAFYLLGLVCDASGDHVAARDHYRKTLYLEPGHREALVHLAALLEMQGDTAGAKRMHDRARRALNNDMGRYE